MRLMRPDHSGMVIQGSFLPGGPKLLVQASGTMVHGPHQASRGPSTHLAHLRQSLQARPQRPGRPKHAGPRIAQPVQMARRHGPPPPRMHRPNNSGTGHHGGHGPAIQLRALGNAQQLPADFRIPSGNMGRPMPKAVQQKMESYFGAEFSDVRVHVGQHASKIGALAFTTGSDVHFAPGRYNPMSGAGQSLLAHELTHVLQQRAGKVRNPFGSGMAVVQDPRFEAEAERMGRGVGQMRTRSPQPVQLSPRSVHWYAAERHLPRNLGRLTVLQPVGEKVLRTVLDQLRTAGTELDVATSADPSVPAARIHIDSPERMRGHCHAITEALANQITTGALDGAQLRFIAASWESEHAQADHVALVLRDSPDDDEARVIDGTWQQFAGVANAGIRLWNGAVADWRELLREHAGAVEPEIREFMTRAEAARWINENRDEYRRVHRREERPVLPPAGRGRGVGQGRGRGRGRGAGTGCGGRGCVIL